MATLQVQRLSIAFADRQLLDDISFTLSERARAALVGANGSGKSTLLQIVAGLMSADIYEYAQPKDTDLLPSSKRYRLGGGTAYEQVSSPTIVFFRLSMNSTQSKNALPG